MDGGGTTNAAGANADVMDGGGTTNAAGALPIAGEMDGSGTTNAAGANADSIDGAGTTNAAGANADGGTGHDTLLPSMDEGGDTVLLGITVKRTLTAYWPDDSAKKRRTV